MLTLIFWILMIIVFGKLLMFAISATWSVARICFSIILLPLALVGLVLKGLLVVAFPILIIVGLITVFALAD